MGFEYLWIAIGAMTAFCVTGFTLFMAFKKKLMAVLAAAGVGGAIGTYMSGGTAVVVSAAHTSYQLKTHKDEEAARWKSHDDLSVEVLKRLEGNISTNTARLNQQVLEFREVRQDVRVLNENLMRINQGRQTGQNVELKKLPEIIKKSN